MCVFCEIINGNIPSTKVYEDDKMLAFKDLNPVAPVHFLCVPKKHIENVNEITPDNSEYVAHIFSKIPEIAKSQGIEHMVYPWFTPVVAPRGIIKEKMHPNEACE